jgi:hypothetical protein
MDGGGLVDEGAGLDLPEETEQERAERLWFESLGIDWGEPKRATFWISRFLGMEHYQQDDLVGSKRTSTELEVGTGVLDGLTVVTAAVKVWQAKFFVMPFTLAKNNLSLSNPFLMARFPDEGSTSLQG